MLTQGTDAGPHVFDVSSFAFPALGILAIAFAASALTQICVKRVAIRWGLLDFPDDERRNHTRAVPRLGGIGVFAGLCVAVVASLFLHYASNTVRLPPLVVAMAVGSTLLFGVGLIDDLRGVAPSVKMLVQTIAALIVIRYGFGIGSLILPTGEVLVLGVLAFPLTVIWIVGVSNAFNLIDGADGLAGGIAILALVATAICGFVLRDVTVVWGALALIGAVLGFLWFNVSPARIFLGDSGSLMIGFLLAILTVKGMSREDGAVYALAPIFALSYPLLDTGISMMRRWIRGDPLSRADGRHIHHQLRALGMGPRQSVFLIFALSALVAGLGLSATFAPPHLTIAIAVAGAAMLALILVYGSRWLQYHELVEAGASLTSAVVTGRSRMQDNILARDIARLIDHVFTVQELRSMIEENARTFRFAHMQLRTGMSRQTPPLPLRTDVHVPGLWALDYPISARAGLGEPLFLSIWCSVDSSKAASAERIAQILAPPIERWIVRCRDQITPESFMPHPEHPLLLDARPAESGKPKRTSRGRRSG